MTVRPAHYGELPGLVGLGVLGDGAPVPGVGAVDGVPEALGAGLLSTGVVLSQPTTARAAARTINESVRMASPPFTRVEVPTPPHEAGPEFYALAVPALAYATGCPAAQSHFVSGSRGRLRDHSPANSCQRRLVRAVSVCQESRPRKLCCSCAIDLLRTSCANPRGARFA